MRKVQGGRLENAVIADALVGISLNQVRKVVVANCTVAAAASVGLSAVGAEESALFNNVVVDAGTGITVGGARQGLRVDHNLYVALYVGKLEGQISRVSLGPWRDVSGGLDANSVSLAVRFADPAAGNYRPISTLTWDPSRVTTADWGVTEFAGFAAPVTDIDGAARVGPPDLGAYEAPRLPAPASDGIFEVSDDAGTKVPASSSRTAPWSATCSRTCRSRRGNTVSACRNAPNSAGPFRPATTNCVWSRASWAGPTAVLRAIPAWTASGTTQTRHMFPSSASPRTARCCWAIAGMNATSRYAAAI
jgi:hypothetical protein